MDQCHEWCGLREGLCAHSAWLPTRLAREAHAGGRARGDQVSGLEGHEALRVKFISDKASRNCVANAAFLLAAVSALPMEKSQPPKTSMENLVFDSSCRDISEDALLAIRIEMIIKLYMNEKETTEMYAVGTSYQPQSLLVDLNFP